MAVAAAAKVAATWTPALSLLSSASAAADAIS